MTPALFALVAVAGGLGAVGRYALDSVARARFGERMPWGTLAINLSGSLLLGFVVGLVGAGVLTEGWRWVLGGGFLGGYTTFSAASFETARLLQDRRFGAGMLNSVGQLVAATVLAGSGLWLGGML